jgi:hypothetical protein
VNVTPLMGVTVSPKVRLQCEGGLSRASRRVRGGGCRSSRHWRKAKEEHTKSTEERYHQKPLYVVNLAATEARREQHGRIQPIVPGLALYLHLTPPYGYGALPGRQNHLGLHGKVQLSPS